MFASAGVDDFAWLRGHHAPTTLDELRAFARIRGRDAGAGHCLWADERAMQLLAWWPEASGVLEVVPAAELSSRRSAT